MDERIIIIENSEEKTFFVSTAHCQTSKESGGKYNNKLCPHTFIIPQDVGKRDSLPSGIVDTFEKLIMIYFSEYTHIKNPNPEYATEYETIASKINEDTGLTSEVERLLIKFKHAIATKKEKPINDAFDNLMKHRDEIDDYIQWIHCERNYFAMNGWG